MTLTLDNFTRKDVSQYVHYLTMDVDGYEITLEPHTSAGFTIAIYDKSDPLLSIKKRAVWKFNHPESTMPDNIERQLLNEALDIAEYYYDYYVLGKNVNAPWEKEQKT